MNLIVKVDDNEYKDIMYRKEHSPRDMDDYDRLVANGTPLKELKEILEVIADGNNNQHN